MKEKLILVMLVMTMMIAICGCIDNPIQTKEEIHTTIIVDETPIEFDEEVELLKRAFAMGSIHGDTREEGANQLVELLHSNNIVIVEMYRGSLIYHEPSYGYFWWPELEDDYRDMSVIRRRYPRDTDLFLIVPQKYNGGNAILTLGDPFSETYWICCFNNLEDTRSFLKYIYSYGEDI